MIPQRPARRRFIQISAAVTGAFLLGGLSPLSRRALAASTITAHSELTTHTWSGIALGADASLQITHPDPLVAQTLIERCVAEVQRLESLFSLYRDDSALSILNRQGFLNEPSNDFLTLLDRSKEFSRLTDGMFDVTVQPLWQAYTNYFASAHNLTEDSQTSTALERSHAEDRIAAMPTELQRDIHDALKRVDWRMLDIDPQKVRLSRPGMAVTLNGIAQGYITDRITQLLAANGVDHALVNMGEIYGLNPDSPTADQPWHVGLEDAHQPGSIAARVPVHNQAVATSGAHGTPFTPDLRHNHLLDPRKGLSSHRYHSVSVVASDATTADALSTAFSLMPEPAIKRLSRELGVQTYLQARDETCIRRV